MREIEADVIWRAVRNLLKRVAVDVPNMDAVGITSFGESFVLLGEDDKVLAPVMMYTDLRGEIQTQQLNRKLGPETIADIAGTLPHPMFSLPKLMWIKQEQPDLYSHIKHVFLIADFIAYMLTGQRMIDYSLATRTMGFDIRKLEWSQSIFEAADIDPVLFSHPIPSGGIVGTLRPDLMEVLGLPQTLQKIMAQMYMKCLKTFQRTSPVEFWSCLTFRALLRLIWIRAPRACFWDLTSHIRPPKGSYA